MSDGGQGAPPSIGIEADPLVGRRVGSYVIERRLGAGGMGAVYTALQPEIGKRVAVKFLAAHLSSDPAIVSRFFDEARAVNLIAHENIVDIFDFGRTGDGYSYFVMELLSGRSLADEVAAGTRMPEARARAVVLQITDALCAAHTRGIVHRDLKPDNIYLTRAGGREDFVKVLDFGIAKLGAQSAAGQQTVTGVVMGTPGFMAPEQAQGDVVDGRADVYALGVLLYVMLAGALPFTGPTLLAIVHAQLEDHPRSLDVLAPEVSPALRALIHQMIAATPDARPGTMTEVLARLTTLDGSIAPLIPPTLVRPAAGRPPSTAVPKRSRRVLGVLALGCICAATLVIGAVRHAQSPPEAAAPAPAAAPVVASPPAATPVFSVSIASTPPGAAVFAGAHELGTTPTMLTLERATSLRLHLSGYFDEVVDSGPSTPVLAVALRRVVAPPEPATATPDRRRRRGPSAALPSGPKHGISLDD